MKKIIRQHWAIIIFALIVGLLTIAPVVRSIAAISPQNFKGIFPVFNTDRLFYMSMTQEAYEGHWGLGNTYVQEHKNEPYVQPPLAEIVLAGLAKTTNLNIPNLFFILDFVLPAVIVILLYLIFFTLTKSRLASFGLAALHVVIYLEQYAMSVNPQFSFVPFFVGIYFIVRIFIDPEKINNVIYNTLAGLMTVILVYIYPFFWSSLFVLYFLLAFFNYLRDNRDIKYVKNAVYFLIPFILFLLPYLFNLYQATRNPFYLQTISRYGLVATHWPNGYYDVAMIILTLAALMISKKFFAEKKYWYLAICLPLACWCLCWQNVITGKYMQFSSHYHRTTVLFCMMAFALICYCSLKVKNSLVIKITVACLFLLFSFQVLYRQGHYTIKHLTAHLPQHEMTSLQDYAVLFDWLNKNTAPDAVVYCTNDQLINYLTVYTRNNTYLPSYGIVNLMSDDELENRWASQTIFNKTIDQNYVNQADVWGNKFIDRYQMLQVRKKLLGLVGIKVTAPATRVPPEYSAELLQKYEEYQQGNPEILLKRYKLDYLVITEADPFWQAEKKIVDGFSFFRPEAKLGHYYIYKTL